MRYLIIDAKKLIPAVMVAVVLMFAVSDGAASIVVYDGFDMGDASGGLSGKTSATDVGLDGSWSTTGGTASYDTSGLTFGSGATELTVTGGKAKISSGGNDAGYNGLDVTQSGTIYGSYLLQPHSLGRWEVNSLHVTGDSDIAHDGKSQFSLQGIMWDGTIGAINFGQSGNKSANSGVDISTATTYMMLFKGENIGGSGASMKSWILTSDQFDNFRNGGLSETELDNASTGTGSANVLQKGSESGTAFFDSSKNLAISSNDSDTSFDEIRFSDTSLTEVAPIPEPASLFLLAGFGLIGFLRHRLLRRRRK